MDGLTSLIRNLLIDNKNFTSADDRSQPRHFVETPTAAAFVRGPLRTMAEAILDQAEATKSLAVDMASAPDVPGLSRSYTGLVRDREVTLVEEAHDRWRLTLAIPDAASADDDRVGLYASEGDALDAVRTFLRDGSLDPLLVSPAALAEAASA